MGSQKTKTKSQETATTTPNVPDWAAGPVQNYMTSVGGLMANPTAGITPANDLMTGAWSAGANLGNGSQGMADARSILGNAGQFINQAAPVTAQTAALPDQYTTAKVGNIAYGPLAQAQMAALPQAAQVDVQGIADGIGGGAVDTSFLDNAQAAGYGGASILPLIEQFQNPYRKQVVDATLADLAHQQAKDQAGFTRLGAANNAFGGSGFRIGQAELLDSQARTKATTQAGLLAQMYQNALEAAAQQAGLTNAAGIASMQSRNQFESDRLGNKTQAGIANARNATDAGIARAGLLSDAALFNAGAKNDFGLAGFNAANELGMFNAGQFNDVNSRIYDTLNTNARQNAAAQNDALGQFYSTTAQNNQFNANAANRANEFNSGLALDKASAWGNLAGQTADLAQAENGMRAQNLGLMSDLGNQQYAYDQQFSPYSYLGAQQGLLDPSMWNPFVGQTINTQGTSTSKKSGGLLGQLLGAGAQLGSAAIMASERRVKRDIVKLGEEPDGLGRYSFRYIWDSNDEPPRFGAMVDEVERLRPWALGPVVDGIKTVNYGAL